MRLLLIFDLAAFCAGQRGWTVGCHCCCLCWGPSGWASGVFVGDPRKTERDRSGLRSWFPSWSYLSPAAVCFAGLIPTPLLCDSVEIGQVCVALSLISFYMETAFCDLTPVGMRGRTCLPRSACAGGGPGSPLGPRSGITGDPGVDFPRLSSLQRLKDGLWVA